MSKQGTVRRWLRGTLKAILILVLTGLVASGSYLGYVAIRHTLPVTLPPPSGPYKVGRITTEWTDQSRVDRLAPRSGVRRAIAVWLWYPATPKARGPRAPYTPGIWGQLHFDGILGVGQTSFNAVRTHSLAGAEVASGRFPVAILQPGLGLSAPQYTTIAENLASQGYVVAGITPTYSANLTVLHGRAVHATKTGNPPMDGTNLHTGQAANDGDRLVSAWAADARFAAATIKSLDRAGRFDGHIDPTRTTYIGHSLGGAAALEACRTDPQCAGAADIDGPQFGTVIHAGLDKPFLILTSAGSTCLTGSCQSPTTGEQADRTNARMLLEASTGKAWCHTISGTEHFNFTDYAAYYLTAPLRSLLPLGKIDGNQGLTETNKYLTGFLNQTVDIPVVTEPTEIDRLSRLPFPRHTPRWAEACRDAQARAVSPK